MKLKHLLPLILATTAFAVQAATVPLLNVSYDPTREFYGEYNKAFADYWLKKTGDTVVITQSHGGSGKQARAVIDGLPADVVTLGLPADIDAIASKGHALAPDWATRLPNQSSPYTSTVVLLVRKGNPKGIHDWSDLAKPGVEVVTSNPKTSSGGRWAYLAAYGYAFRHGGKDHANEFIKSVYANVKILDTGARASTQTFIDRSQGDVLLAWENEALLTTKKLNPSQFEIVYPSESILAEPPVAVVDKNVALHKNQAVAEAYLQYLYSPEGQEIAAQHFYRPRLPDVAAKHADQFPNEPLFTVADTYGDWKKINAEHFNAGALFDQIYTAPAPTPSK